MIEGWFGVRLRFSLYLLRLGLHSIRFFLLLGMKLIMRQPVRRSMVISPERACVVDAVSAWLVLYARLSGTVKAQGTEPLGEGRMASELPDSQSKL